MAEQKWLVISGDVVEVERKVNENMDRYIPTMWNFAVVGLELVVTVVLLDKREFRQLAAPQNPLMMPPWPRN